MTDTIEATRDISEVISKDSSRNVFGWTVTDMPPEPPGFDQQGPEASGWIALEEQAVPPIPTQTVLLNGSPTFSFANEQVAGFRQPQLSFTKINNGAFLDTGGVGINAGGYLYASLNMSSPVAVKLTVSFAAIVQGDHQSEVTVEINGAHIVNRQHDSNVNWHPLEFDIPPSYFKEGANEIALHAPSEKTIGFWVQSLTISTDDVSLVANFQWQRIASGQIAPAGYATLNKGYTTGVVSTESQMLSFTETIGMKVSGGITVEGVANLGAELNASFSSTQSFTSSIALSKSQTQTLSNTITNQSDSLAIFFEIWQGQVEFVLNDNPANALVQDLTSGQCAFVMHIVDQNGNVIM